MVSPLKLLPYQFCLPGCGYHTVYPPTDVKKTNVCLHAWRGVAGWEVMRDDRKGLKRRKEISMSCFQVRVGR